MNNNSTNDLTSKLTNNKKEEVNGMKVNKNLVEKIANELKVNEGIRNWYRNEGWEKIETYVDDVDGIFSTDNGYKAGVYGVYVVTPLAKEIPMYIGEVGKENRGFRDRIMEHMKHWINKPEHFCGVKISELENGYKYKVKILAEEKDYAKRYNLEQTLIEEIKPYLQFSCYQKYDTTKSGYRGVDVAIWGTYRRRAFIVARDGKYTPELFVDNVFALRNKVDFNDYKNATPNEELVELIKKEMPNGSDVWRNVKAFVEMCMGINSERGCRYSYLVKVVAAVLEPTYKAKIAL